MYIVLENKEETAETIAERYGAFTADLLAGSFAEYPNIALHERLEDGSVFEVQCGTLGGAQ